MRILLLALLVSSAAPALAQNRESTQQRLERIEQELRAVQRRVFPGRNVEPEIGTAVQPGTPAGTVGSSPAVDLSSRMDAIESQLRTLTGQSETNENRLRQIEEALTLLRTNYAARLDALEGRGAAAAPKVTATTRPASPAPATIAPSGAATRRTGSQPPPDPAPVASAPADPSPVNTPTSTNVDEAEEAYNAGFRLWDQKRYPDAQRALEAMARTWPRHRLASWARNLAGRAYLDEGKPATAARMFLANYTDNPRGERAADSLFFLGQSLATLNKPVDACKAYDELREVYGENVREFLKERLPAARREANCR